MEADRSIGGRTRRKPLADCTNTVATRISRPSSSSTSSSTAVVKSANPSLFSSLKRIIDNTTLKDRIRDGNKSGFVAGSASRSRVTTVSNPSSADPIPPTTTPSRSHNSRCDRSAGHKEIVEPYSVYTKRKASVERKSKEFAVPDPVDCPLMDLVSRSRERTHRADKKVSKPLRAAPKKRQRGEKRDRDGSQHTLPQEFIEQQRAYFAEVDAFELSEEEEVSRKPSRIKPLLHVFASRVSDM